MARLRSASRLIVPGSPFDGAIGVGGNDWQARPDGSFFDSAAVNMVLGHDGTGTPPSEDRWRDIGLRRQLILPAGIIVDDAYWTFEDDGSNDAENVTVEIAAVDDDDPAAPTSGGLSTWGTLTTARVNWTMTDPTQTPNLAAIVQELNDTYDYTGGGAAVLFTFRVTVGPYGNYARLAAFDHTTAAPPSLHVEWH